MSSLSPAALAAARSRARYTLMAGVALGSIGNSAAFTVATIVANDLGGSATFAGVPGATIVLGSALGSVLLSSLMARRGRRIGLVLGYGLGVVGALVATGAIVGRSFPLLLVGTVFIGFAAASNQLARYAASDLVPAARRSSAIGLVVWGATLGSVAGPWLVPFSSELVASYGLPPLAGPFLVPVAIVGLAAILIFAMLRPDPYEIAYPDHAPVDGLATSSQPLRATLLRPWVAAAIVAVVVAQVVMVLIMTMTPLHMAEHGHNLGAVGVVLSGHALGMYALSPLSGRLAERIGNVATIFLGTGVLALAAIMAALAPPTGGVILFVALFLLGYGWNLGFVAGSSLLSSSLEVHERTRIQGVADALIWSAAAAASLGSGVVVAVAGYTALGILGAGAVILPILWLRAAARSARPAATA